MCVMSDSLRQSSQPLSTLQASVGNRSQPSISGNSQRTTREGTPTFISDRLKNSIKTNLRTLKISGSSSGLST